MDSILNQKRKKNEKENYYANTFIFSVRIGEADNH